jgi:hypothetical protein
MAWRNSRHPARVVFAYLAHRYGDLRMREVAPILGLSRADCVPNLLRRAERAAADSEIAVAIEQLEQALQLRIPATHL